MSSEALLFTICRSFSAIIDQRFNKQSSINSCLFNITNVYICLILVKLGTRDMRAKGDNVIEQIFKNCAN